MGLVWPRLVLMGPGGGRYREKLHVVIPGLMPVQHLHPLIERAYPCGPVMGAVIASQQHLDSP